MSSSLQIAAASEHDIVRDIIVVSCAISIHSIHCHAYSSLLQLSN